jgi:hypothetical protein
LTKKPCLPKKLAELFRIDTLRNSKTLFFNRNSRFRPFATIRMLPANGPFVCVKVAFQVR